MTKAEIRETVETCMKNRKLCRAFMRYDLNYFYYFPLMLNDNLFLGIEEDDFLLNGYSIRRFRDVTKAQVKDDRYEEILKDEGVIKSIVVPDVDITSWQTTFTSLQRINKNIIVEHENLNEKQCIFVIGRIEKVFKNFAYFRHFDADEIWQDEPYKIPYAEITSVSFGTRYVDTFSKYLCGLPQNFGK